MVVKGSPLNCSICGAMYSVTTRTGIQREKAYAVHQATERHHDAVKALLEADDGAGWTALAMTFAKSPGPKDVLGDH